jgi:hypothetical protein
MQATEGVRVVVVPHGTRLLSGGVGIDLPGVGIVRVGEEITGGGGIGPSPTAAAECGGTDDVAWMYIADTDAADTSETRGVLDSQHRGGSILLAPTTQPGGAFEAAVTGTLALNDHGCFGFGDGAAFSPVIFPFGTRLLDDGRSAEVPGLGTVRIGDEIRGGGGQEPSIEASDICGTTGDATLWQTVG